MSTDPAHSTSHILETELGPEPRPVVADCWAMELDPEREADRYIEAVKARVESAAPPRLLAEVERQIDAARVSPGAVEAALFERFTRILEEEGEEFDRIVFDTAPTGQTLRLLSLPELMTAWMTGLVQRRKKVSALSRMWRNVAGSAEDAGEREDPILAALEERRARFHRARGTLTDPERTAFVFVVIPERLPVLETEKAVRTLSRHGIPVGAIVVNQVLPEFAAAGAPASGEGARPGARPGGAHTAEGFLAGRRARQAEHLARIARIRGDWPVLALPLLETDPVGVDALRELGAALAPAPSGWTEPAEESG